MNNASASQPDGDKEGEELSKSGKDLGSLLFCARYYLIEVVVLRMLRYWRMSGTDMSLMARRNRNPIHVLSKYMETKEGGMVK